MQQLGLVLGCLRPGFSSFQAWQVLAVPVQRHRCCAALPLCGHGADLDSHRSCTSQAMNKAEFAWACSFSEEEANESSENFLN